MELDTCRELSRAFAEAIIAQDYDLAHSMFAPWLQRQVSSAALEQHVEAELQGMAEAWELEEPVRPKAYDIDQNAGFLYESLRTHDQQRRAKPGVHNTRPADLFVSPEVTGENYRVWMVAVFKPQEGEAEFDAFFDMWMALVEVDGQCRIGYFELSDPD